MDNILDLKFWFDFRPGALMPIFQKVLLAFLVLLFIIALVTWLLKIRKKGFYLFLWQKINVFSLVNLFLGLVILFLNYELVPFLSARFWFLVWGASMLVWLFFIIKVLKTVPAKRKEAEAEKEFKRYIP